MWSQTSSEGPRGSVSDVLPSYGQGRWVDGPGSNRPATETRDAVVEIKVFPGRFVLVLPAVVAAVSFWQVSRNEKELCTVSRFYTLSRTAHGIEITGAFSVRLPPTSRG